MNTNKTLIRDVSWYLIDAGFTKELYILEDFDNKREYVEVFFSWGQAVDYVYVDIKKSDFSELLEIKKYRYKNGIYSAIITYELHIS